MKTEQPKVATLNWGDKDDDEEDDDEEEPSRKKKAKVPLKKSKK